MQPTDAHELVNFYPGINEVVVRRGHTQHATGVGAGNVDTVVEFFDGTNRQLIAASSTNIYNATTAGAAVSLGTGFTDGRWQTVTKNGVMALVNGADTPQQWDGTTLSNLSITGTTSSELIGCHVFKGRVLYWKAASPSFWYTALNALGGTVTEFALGEVARLGGNLVTATSWTRDGGAGVDDFAVFIMSSGEVLVYKGTDPGSDFALVGSYKIPTPLDIRGTAKIGGEVLVFTDSDIVFAPSSFAKPAPPASKLKGAVETAGPAYRTNTGWQALHYSKRNTLLLNVPISSTQFEQYVVNLETGAPAKFTDWNGRAFGVFNDDLYFGGTDGIVYQADIGTNDNGSVINCDARQAWNNLGTFGNKRVTAYRPVFSGTDDFEVGSEIAYDFTDEAVDRVVTTGGSSTPWGSAWGSPWSSALVPRQEWVLATGQGEVISSQISISVSGQRPAWYRTDLVIAQGLNV